MSYNRVILNKVLKMRKFLTNGAGSNIYEDFDPIHGDIIIKKSRYEPGSQKDKDYIEKQTLGYNLVQELLESGQDVGVDLPGLISIDEDKREIVEKRIDGVDFKTQVYESLSEKAKDTIAQQMALFLNSMHQLRQPQKPQNSIKQIFDRYKNDPSSAQQFLDVFEHKLSKRTEQMILDAEKYLITAKIDDELHVMTHKDLRGQNVMFNKNKQKLSVIDFEMASIANIYWDFVPQSPSSIISWDFTQRVVKYYNAIKNKKYPIEIDVEKVRNALVYGITHEYTRVLKWDKEHNPKDDLVKNRAKILANKLAALLSSDNKDKFHEANKKIQKKLIIKKHIRDKFQND